MSENESSLSFWVIVGVVFLGLAGVSLAFTNIPPHDLWWQIRTGQIIATEHRIPTRDPFSFTAKGELWLVHEWLSSLFFYLLMHNLGWDSLVYLKFALIAAALIGLALAGRMRGAPLLYSTSGGVFALYAFQPWMAIRPQLFTYAFFPLFLALMERARRNKNPAYLFPLLPITALWANFHAGALLAPVLLAIEVVGDLADHLWSWTLHKANREGIELNWNWTGWLGGMTVGVALATLLTPHGLALWSYPGKVTGHPVVTDFITEWRSPDFHAVGLYPFAFFTLLLLAVLILQGSRPPIRDYLLLTVMLCTAMVYKRNIPLFVIAAAPILIGRSWGLMTGWGWNGRIRWDGVGAAACLLSSIQFGGVLRSWSGGGLFDSEAGLYDFPSGAVEYLKNNLPTGSLFHDYRWGGYLIWQLPNVPVFIDGRAEVYYHRGVFDDYLAVHQLKPGWRDVLAKYKINTVLVDSGMPLAQLLMADPAWRIAYQDRQSVVLLRDRVK